MKKQKFKVGNKVKVVGHLFHGEPNLIGRTGVVTQIESAESVCIQILGWDGGHSGETQNYNISDRWYFAPEELKLITKSKKKVVKKVKKVRK